MAIASSRISSKVIADPSSVDEVCRRRCGDGRYRQSAYIPQRADKGKPAALGARCAEEVALRIQKSRPLAFLALPLVFCPCYKTLATDQLELLTREERKPCKPTP